MILKTAMLWKYSLGTTCAPRRDQKQAYDKRFGGEHCKKITKTFSLDFESSSESSSIFSVSSSFRVGMCGRKKRDIFSPLLTLLKPAVDSATEIAF